jgi:hypothetical protein
MAGRSRSGNAVGPFLTTRSEDPTSDLHPCQGFRLSVSTLPLIADLVAFAATAIVQ